MNTANDFLLSSNGANLIPMLPVHIINRDQALRTAAWLVLLGDMLPDEGDDHPTFDQVLEAIANT